VRQGLVLCAWSATTSNSKWGLKVWVGFDGFVVKLQQKGGVE
jgi:hypothetical protein